MKKLMTVIAAVAMSFGLYAADATPKFITSFDGIDDGVVDGVFTPADPWSGITTGMKVGAWADEKTSPYAAEGANVRRPEFNTRADNVNFLPLETGKDTLTLAVGDVFVDQAVKFTGFEEEQTFDTASADCPKVAVWMSAIEADDQAETPVPGETNLYVSCASAVGYLKAKLDFNAVPDQWYRLTIKSVGNIMKEGTRGGFLIYINGTQVSSADAQFAFSAEDLDPKFGKFVSEGKLFAAMTTDNATFASIGYQGIGGIDDIIVDTDGPEFCQFVDGTVAPILGAKLVLTADGEVVPVNEDGTFQAAPGSTLLFTYTAIEGNFLTGGKTTATRTGNIDEKQNYNFNEGEDKIESKLAVAMATVGAEYIYFASLQEAFDAEGAEELVLQANVELGAADAAITVPAAFDSNLDLNGHSIKRVAGNSYLMVVSTGAELKIKDELETGTIEYYPCALGFTKSPATNTNMDKQVPSSMIRNLGTLKLGDGATLKSDYCCVKNDEGQNVIGDFTMSGGAMKIVPCDGYYGLTFTIMNWGVASITGGSHKGNVQTLADKTNKGCQASTLTIDDGAFDPAEIYLCAYDNEAFPTLFLSEDLEVTLTPVAKPMVDGLNLKVVDATAEEGYVGYTLAEVDYVASVQINGGALVSYATVAEALAAVQDAEAKGLYPIVVTALADDGLTIENEGRKAWIPSEATITITAGKWTVDNLNDANMKYSGAIDGELETLGGSIEKFDGSITLNKGAQVTVPALYGSKQNIFSANTGYQVDEEEWPTPEFQTPIEKYIYTVEAETYTITYMYDNETIELQPASYTVEDETKTLPADLGLTGVTFLGWYDNAGFTGVAVTEIPAGSTGDKTFYAKTETIIDPAQQVIDDKVEGTPEQKAAAKANTQKLVNLLGDKDKTEAWIEKVYGSDAKITAATLAAAPATSVDIAVAFDVPVMVNPTISAPVVATATEGPAAFEFAIKDGATDVEIKTLTENVKKIVKYAAALGGTNTFGPAKDTEVAIGLNAGKIKAEFVAGPAAGFMKADFTVAK